MSFRFTVPLGKRRLINALVALALALILSNLTIRTSAVESGGAVFVLGTLYRRHETIAGYDLASLRKVILAINPDVLVLDVNPIELKEQKVSPGKIEYPGVIFPLLNERKLRAYPAEPAEPMFSEIVQAAINGRTDLEKNNPEGMAAMKQFRASTFEALSKIWKTPADVNGDVTERVIGGLKAYEARMIGPIEHESGTRWDHHAVSVVRQAIRENPGKRILQITGIENCPNIRTELRSDKRINLIEMEAWLRAIAKE